MVKDSGSRVLVSGTVSLESGHANAQVVPPSADFGTRRISNLRFGFVNSDNHVACVCFRLLAGMPVPEFHESDTGSGPFVGSGRNVVGFVAGILGCSEEVRESVTLNSGDALYLLFDGWSRGGETVEVFRWWACFDAVSD